MKKIPVFVAVVLGACGTGSPSRQPSDEPAERTRSAPLMSTPPGIVALCDEIGATPACPRALPRMRDPYRARIIDLSHGPGPESRYQVLDISSFGPGSRFVHLVVKTGDLRNGFAFPLPIAVAQATASPSARSRSPSDATLLGTPRWGGRLGVLALAPAVPAGGMDGDHLIFRWRRDGIDHALSIHAWRPLAATKATLQALVGSIPPPSSPPS